MRQILRIATRKSPLALWQAEFIKNKLQAHYPSIKIELVKFTTTGDRFLEQSLSKIGGKGLFTKELERALLEHQADIAVHSMKDVPADFPKGLMLSTIIERADARDALITKDKLPLEALKSNAIIGTSSLRRAIQIKTILPHCEIKPLRGNINTRLSKLNEFDAIILASIGLKRLKLEDNISHFFALDEMIPAAGQGVLGIECRSDDQDLLELLAPLNSAKTEALVSCERHFNQRLNGRCDVPIAAHASLSEGVITLNTMVGSINSSKMIKTSTKCQEHSPLLAAREAANELIERGAKAILADNP